MRALVLLETVTLKETRHNLDVRASVKPNKSAPFASRNANWQLWAAEIALNSNFWSLTGLLYASYWNILKQNNLLHQQLNGYHSKKGVTPMFSLGPSLQKPSTTSPSCKKVKIPSDTRACVKSYGSLGPKERCCSRVSVAWLSEKPTAGFPECCRWLTYESTLQS